MVLKLLSSLTAGGDTAGGRRAAAWLALVFVAAVIVSSAGTEACYRGAGRAEREIVHAKGVRLVVNGTAIETQEPLWVWRGITYLPLEYSVMLRLNLRVGIYKEEGGRVLQVGTNGTEIEFREERCVYAVNGVEGESPGVPMLDTDYPAVPLRVFFSAIGAEIQWIEKEKKIYVTVVPEEAKKTEELPPGVFAPKKEKAVQPEAQPAAQPAAPPAAEPVQAPAAEPAPKPKKKLQYTFENTMGINMSTVSGDETASSIEGETIGHNLFNLRAEDTLGSGYKMNAGVRAVETTDVDQKVVDFDKLSVSFSKDAKMIEMYDLYPKFSQYLMRLYRLQGVRYVKGDKDEGVEIIVGKTPKKIKDSEYARYAGGASVRKKYGDALVKLNYARTKDTGTRRSSEKVSNDAVSVVTEVLLMRGWKMLAEYAGGDAAGEGRGRAGLMKFDYKTKKTRMEVKYERTGAGFVSETSVFPKSRSEFSTTYQRKPSNRLMYAFGHKQRYYKGERTYFYPASLTLKPLERRSSLKLDLWREFQRTAGSQYESADERGVRLMDKFGKAAVDIKISRRKTKDEDGTLYRTTRGLKVRYPFTEKLYSTWKYSTERRQQSSTPLMRSMGVRMEFEVAPWTDLVCGVDRYYNATNQNNYEYTVGFRKVNIMEDWETGLDVNLKNYPDHNDLILKGRYTFIR